MKLTSFIALAVALVVVAPTVARADSQIDRQMANTGVVLFQGNDATGAHAIGAGAIVNITGSGEVTILTAAHVALMKNLSVTFADGTAGAVESVKAAPDGSDAATVIVQMPQVSDDSLVQSDSHYHVYRLADVKPQSGDSLTIVGHPLGQLWLVSHGTVSDFRTATVTLVSTHPGYVPPVTEQNYPDFSFTCSDCAAGDSGGPVLNSKGEIVGIVSGETHTGDGTLIEVCTQRENFVGLVGAR